MGNSLCHTNTSVEDDPVEQDVLDELPDDFHDGEERFFLEEEEPEEVEEENFMAIRPWIGPMNGSTPMEYRDPNSLPPKRRA
ncbi:hypothetical protein GEMRC1_008857 [Eukaryota sp. GEM-RC1]